MALTEFMIPLQWLILDFVFIFLYLLIVNVERWSIAKKPHHAVFHNRLFFFSSWKNQESKVYVILKLSFLHCINMQGSEIYYSKLFFLKTFYVIKRDILTHCYFTWKYLSVCLVAYWCICNIKSSFNLLYWCFFNFSQI